MIPSKCAHQSENVLGREHISHLNLCSFFLLITSHGMFLLSQKQIESSTRVEMHVLKTVLLEIVLARQCIDQTYFKRIGNRTLVVFELAKLTIYVLCGTDNMWS